MLYESERISYYSYKYGPLFLSAAGLYSAITLVFISEEGVSELVINVVLLLALSGAGLYLFVRLKPMWKIVALNRMRIVVGVGKDEEEYSWLDVKSIDFNGLTSVYTLNLKTGQEIYFTAYRNVLFFWAEDTSEMGAIINKMKRDLSI